MTTSKPETFTLMREIGEKPSNEDRDQRPDRPAPASGAAATKPSGKFQIPANWKTPCADGMKFAISVSPFFGNTTQVNSLWAKCPIEMVLVP
jgi:hypothetical protein